MKRGSLFTLHSFIGLISGLFILVMSLSGAALVFHDELDRLQYASVVQKNNLPLLSVDSCYAGIHKKFPHAQISSCSVAENTANPFIFSAYDSSFEEGKQSMQVFLHPQTGEILKIRGGGKDISDNFMGWLSVFHNSFHLQTTGEWLLGFFGVLFLLSICTGIVLYRRKIVAALLFKKILFRKANLHQLIGVYALLFNLMIGISGVWMQRYVFKKPFYAAEQPYTQVIKPSAPLFFNIDSALQAAHKAYPSFTGYVIYFAASPKRKTAVYGSRSTNSFIHSRKFADVLFLDSAGAVAKTAFVTEIEPASRYDIINSQIHFGKYGGWPVKIIYSLFGLSGGFLSITGFLLWLRRKKQTRLR